MDETVTSMRSPVRTEEGISAVTMTAAMFRSRRSLAETVIPNPSSILAIICTLALAPLLSPVPCRPTTKPSRRSGYRTPWTRAMSFTLTVGVCAHTLTRGRQYEEKYCSPNSPSHAVTSSRTNQLNSLVRMPGLFLSVTMPEPTKLISASATKGDSTVLSGAMSRLRTVPESRFPVPHR